MDDSRDEVIRLIATVGNALGVATLPVSLPGEIQQTLAATRQLYGAAACSFAQVEPDGAHLRFVAAEGVGAHAIIGVKLPLTRGIVGWVAMSGEPIQIADATTDSRFARDIADATNYVPTTVLAAPVVDSAGETAGVIEVLDPTGRTTDAGEDLAVLSLIGSQLASIIRLSAQYDALGAGLLQWLADPQRTGAFDDAIAAVAAPELDVSLNAVAEAFRDLANGGPAAARLAERILREVAHFAQERR